MFSWPKFFKLFHKQLLKPGTVAASSLAVIILCFQWVPKQLAASLGAPSEAHVSANVPMSQIIRQASATHEQEDRMVLLLSKQSALIQTIFSTAAASLVVICSPAFLFSVTDQASVPEEFTFGSKKCSDSPSFFID